jgi:hypothetical protein
MGFQGTPADATYAQPPVASGGPTSLTRKWFLSESEASDAITDHETPITSRITTMIATLFSTSHSRSLSNGPRIRADATRWATTGTATVEVAIAVNSTMTTAA